MKSGTYTPKPLDTADVELPESLCELTEAIAENVHDIWAQRRMAEGWVYGLEKDPSVKTTPLLVPYADLPDSEKMYDRNTAIETLKFIVKKGYKISE